MMLLEIFEATGTFFGILGCIILNILSANPPILLINSLYIISSILLAYTSYKRNAKSIMWLMIFYGVMGMYGIHNLGG